ncbi:MAG: ankyrin repeat domain-containing protein, partial [Candidatus Omnitrophica bacterium]|nr:ankyrin repeat domain-containing protein [Candidatus Omnitrophota bacterium]
MRGFFIVSQKNIFYRCLSGLVVFVLTFSLIFSPTAGYAQSIFTLSGVEGLNLPVPGTMIHLSPAFAPVLLKGMTIHPNDPLKFDFIIDSGNTYFTIDEIKKETERLVKYFLASMTVPKDDLWVNLSPYENDRIIPDELGKTELGRDMLAQDYILKQLTASLMYPEKELGEKFWDKVYQKAEEQFGTSEIPVNTFNKVWILPENATVYEHEQTVYVVDAKLKVMLDSDYLAMDFHQKSTDRSRGSLQDDTSEMSESIIREIIIPEIEREVNEGEHFATLRQIYHSLILAKWYKETIKNSLLSQVYVDQNKIAGVDVDDKTIKDQIYARYMEAYKKGVFNYIKEDYDQLSQEMIPRKYFSGGIEELTNVSLKRTNSPVVDSKNLKYRMKVGVSPTGNKEGMLSKLTRMARTATITALISALTYAGGGYDALAQEDNTEVPQTQKALLTTTVSVDNEAKAKDFVMAAYNGDISKVQALLQSGIGVDAKYNGFTALMISAEKGYTEIVKALLNKGADVNIKSSAGWTALIIAAQKGHAKIVEALLDKSTNVDARDKYGLTALDAAKEGKHNDIIEILLEAKAKVQVEQGSQITQNTQIDKDIAEFKSYLKNKSLYVQING